MEKYISKITRTMPSFNFSLLDYAVDGGISESKKAVAYLKESDPEIEITDEVIIEIVRYLNCMYEHRLHTDPDWSDTSIVHDGSSIICNIEGVIIKAKVNISNEEISVEIKTDRFQTADTVTVYDQHSPGRLIDTEIGLLATQECIAEIKESILRGFLCNIS